MSRYLTPLPGLLAGAIEQALNQAIVLDANAPAALAALGDRTLKLELTGLGIDLFFHADQPRLRVSAESERKPDTTIIGSPAALLGMAVPGWRTPGSGVRIEGDAGTAQALEKLLRRLDPDWEALFVERFGAVVGHQLFVFLDQGRQHGMTLARVSADQVGTWLREESGLLVTRGELETFVDQVDGLREAVDRLEQRLSRRRPS